MSDAATNELPETMEIDLDEAVSFNGGTYDRLALKEPTMRQVTQAEARLSKGVTSESLREYSTLLVSLVAGVPKGVIEQMPIRKVNQATAFLQAFIEGK